jgi:hypothetical protein
MIQNEIWKIDYRTIRCHVENQRQKTRLLNLKGATVANVYFFHEKIVGWDVDVHPDKLRFSENILGINRQKEETEFS